MQEDAEQGPESEAESHSHQMPFERLLVLLEEAQQRAAEAVGHDEKIDDSEQICHITPEGRQGPIFKYFAQFLEGMKVVITIPAYNEEHTLGPVLEDIKKAMQGTSYRYALQVVNDGSSDKTAAVAKKHGARVVSHSRNRGLAETFKTEMAECLKLKADIIVHTDADGQYDPRAIPQLIAKVEQGYDLVLGSRFKGRSMSHMPVLKRLGNKAFAMVFSHLLKQRITDSTTGFRAFTADVARDINYINTFTYTQEQLIRAKKQKFRIAEIGIKSRRTRESRLFKGPFQYAIKAWTNILRIYRDYDPLKFFGYIGGTFFTLGFLVGLFILYNIVMTGGAGGIPRVILSALLLITGVQVILFGFLADQHKKE